MAKKPMKIVEIDFTAAVPVNEDELFHIMDTAYNDAVTLRKTPKPDYLEAYFLNTNEIKDFKKRGIYLAGESFIMPTCLEPYVQWYLDEKERRTNHE